MDIDKIENIGVIAGIGLLAYILLRGGVFGALNKASNYIFSGTAGGAVSDIPISTGNVPTGGSTITLGEVAVTSNPINFIPNIVSAFTGGSGGQPSLNLKATDRAFAKIGLTTAEVEKLEKQLGQVNYMALQGRIITGTLTDNDKALLYSAGWDGSEG